MFVSKRRVCLKRRDSRSLFCAWLDSFLYVTGIMDEVGLNYRLDSGGISLRGSAVQGQHFNNMGYESVREVLYISWRHPSYLHYRAMLCYGEVMFPLLIVQSGPAGGAGGRKAPHALIVEMSLVVSL